MSITKQIDYIDGDRHYSEAEILEVKEYIVADNRERDEEGNILYKERVWFPLDTDVFELTEEEINEIQNPVAEVEVIDE